MTSAERLKKIESSYKEFMFSGEWYSLHTDTDWLIKRVKDLERENEILVKAMEWIDNPIVCPACSVSEGGEGLPCYCLDGTNDPQRIASEALEKIRTMRDGRG